MMTKPLRLGTLILALLFARAIFAAPESDSKLAFENGLTAQLGYGPDPQAPFLSDERDSFGVVRYAPALRWTVGSEQWPKWEVYSRLWFSYSSDGASSPLFEDDQQLQEGESLEWRGFYVKVNRLLGRPGLDLTVGRQRYASELGVWWDSSLESVKFNWEQARSSGFLAVGSRFATYNTAIDDLPEDQQSIFYGLGQWKYEWKAKHRFGARLMYENDYSDSNAADPYDVTAVRYGLLFEAQNLDGFITDYYVDVIGIEGDVSETVDITETERSFSGWLAGGELGHRFYEAAWRPRVSARVIVSDQATQEFDGYYLNTVQSDRINIESAYRSAVSGSLLTLNMSNLVFYGLKAELQPRPRQSIDILISHVACNSDKGVSPLRRVQTQGACANKDLGQSYDMNYVWDMYPGRFSGRQVNWRILFNLSYFDAESHLGAEDSEYQALISTEINF